MKKLILFLSLLVASSAGADPEICFTIPSGAGVTRLIQLRDWLRVENNKPSMTNAEASERLFKRGAFELNHEKKRQQLRASAGDLLDAEDAAFWADLPLPESAPPTPTATPTATPTTTPTATPTTAP